MADSETTNYKLVKPDVGGSPDTWGNKSNGNWDQVDSLIKANADAIGAKPNSADVAPKNHTHPEYMTENRVYTGTSSENLDYPIGSMVLVNTGQSGQGPSRNSSVSVYANAYGGGGYALDYGQAGRLSGSWRARGAVFVSNQVSIIAERVG